MLKIALRIKGVAPQPPVVDGSNAFYVNAATGSDLNSGQLGAPWRTAGAIENYAIAPGFVYGALILFRGGQEFSFDVGMSTLELLRSANVRLSSYGSGGSVLQASVEVANFLDVNDMVEGKGNLIVLTASENEIESLLLLGVL